MEEFGAGKLAVVKGEAGDLPRPTIVAGQPAARPEAALFKE